MRAGQDGGVSEALPRVGALQSLPALERSDLLADPVAAALKSWAYTERVAVV